MVFARTVNRQMLTFGVSGKLIMNAVVLYDHQTGSLWSQFLHQAVDGPLTGTRLEFVPAAQTTWSSWRKLHPDTLVLDKGGGYGRDPYSSYYRNNSAGILGESNPDRRLQRKEFVVGVRIGETTKAYPFRALNDQTIVNDVVAGLPLVVLFDRDAASAVVFDRRTEDRTVTFRNVEKQNGTQPAMVDMETGSRWNPMTGEAIEGPLKGTVLRRVPSHYSFWFAWIDFFPDTELFQP